MQLCYHELSHPTNPKRRFPAIPGGSYSIPPLALIIVWAAYRQRKLGWLALRVWLALWEIKCWHEARSNSDGTPYYDTSQIASAIRSPNVATSRLKTALSTLQHLGLINFTSSTIWIAASLDDLQDAELRHLAKQMAANIGHANVARGLRMPRRMLVYLMTSKRPRPVYAGVMFALLIRTMLTKRYETYKGCCTATWIALTFGGDPSSIKSARAQLIAEGWFVRLDTPQRVRQKIWRMGGPCNRAACGKSGRNGTPHVPSKPERNRTPSYRTSRFLTKLKQTSLYSLVFRNPNGKTSNPSTSTTQHAASSLSRRPISRVIPSTEASRRTFFAAIAHAIRVAKRNACGLLRQLVETSAYHQFITQADEDQASIWLARQQPVLNLYPQFPSERPDDLYDQHDQRIASLLCNQLDNAGFRTDNCFALIMTTHVGVTNLAGWTQERWDRAVAAFQARGNATIFKPIPASSAV